MRLVFILAAAIVLGVAGFYGAVLFASESGEVVSLRTRDADGNRRDTRLWVVEHAGAEWVRSGHADKGWFERLEADPRVELERGGESSRRIAVPVSDPEVARAVNEAFARKYGAADWIVALSGDASERVVVRLDPETP